MNLSDKTRQQLRELINEKTEYRKGHELVAFFNALGLKDSYGQGFPSRWVYTDDRLKAINGKKQMGECVKSIFSPVNFIGRVDDLNILISDFNEYLAFDGYHVLRRGKHITIEEGSFDGAFEEPIPVVKTEDDFLNLEFEDVPLSKLGLDGVVTDILEQRIGEIKSCLSANAPLSVIFLCGSTLEGILLGVATGSPKKFNQAQASPKDKEGKVKPFEEWTLANFINVARSLDLIGEDVKKFSHALRDFRNYIHPYHQMSEKFTPDKHTAKMCWQVLAAAIFQLNQN